MYCILQFQNDVRIIIYLHKNCEGSFYFNKTSDGKRKISGFTYKEDY